MATLPHRFDAPVAAPAAGRAAAPRPRALAGQLLAALGRAFARERRSFRDLDPHVLRDIGLTRVDVALKRAERRRPGLTPAAPAASRRGGAR